MSNPALHVSDSVVTDIAFAPSLTFVPPNYTVISRTSNGSEDANLNSDRFLHKKYRYLCYRKEKIANCLPSTPVLVSLVMVPDGSTIPAGFKPIVNAYLTGERVFRKKTVCAKHVPFASCQSAISDVAVRSRTGQSVPPGYIVVGEVHSLLIVYTTTPVVKANTSSDPPAVPHLPFPAHPHIWHSNAIRDGDGPSAFKPMGPVHPLMGVPFDLNKKYSHSDPTESENLLKSLIIKTSEQLDTEYDYRFTLERQIVQA